MNGPNMNTWLMVHRIRGFRNGKDLQGELGLFCFDALSCVSNWTQTSLTQMQILICALYNQDDLGS